jgi:hypothetical protein
MDGESRGGERFGEVAGGWMAVEERRLDGQSDDN